MITFDSLFEIMLTELPIIDNVTSWEEIDAWTSRYPPDGDLQVFLERLGDAVLAAAHQKCFHKEKSFHIANVNRVYCREVFESHLRYGLTDPVISYTPRDIELVEEYFRNSSLPDPESKPMQD